MIQLPHSPAPPPPLPTAPAPEAMLTMIKVMMIHGEMRMIIRIFIIDDHDNHYHCRRRHHHHQRHHNTIPLLSRAWPSWEAHSETQKWIKTET